MARITPRKKNDATLHLGVANAPPTRYIQRAMTKLDTALMIVRIADLVSTFVF